ncbi:MAG TPA: hypothetical protein VN903_37350 [Polyangia bacterium]|nr:hypothetical protein [Polyangia bacterium]
MASALTFPIVLTLLAAAEARDGGTADAAAAADAAPAPAAESPETRAEAQLRGFMDLVAAEWPRFRRDNFRFHPAFADIPAGFCVDIRLKSKLDDRQFYKPADAIAFLLAVDRVAARTGAHWRVLYDDWTNVGEIVRRRAKRGSFYAVARMNPPFLKHAVDEPLVELMDYHGPGELKLHMHLDVSLDPPRGAR